MGSAAAAKARLQESQRRKSRTWATYHQMKKYRFPNCIGLFPECKGYKPDDPIEKRPECKLCPYNKK